MNQEQFNGLTEKLLTDCKDALGMKAGEYAREGDRLHNFYAAARKRNRHPLDSLLGMQVKHRVSLDDICEDIVKHGKFPTDEMMLEKFKDDINYNLLAFALIHELREKARKDAYKKGPEFKPEFLRKAFEKVAADFMEDFRLPGFVGFSASFTPHKEEPGTISRMAAMFHPNSMQKVLFDEQYFLPVPEEKENNCTGCFFKKAEVGECERFRAVAGSRFDDFCEGEGIVWKKII